MMINKFEDIRVGDVCIFRGAELKVIGATNVRVTVLNPEGWLITKNDADELCIDYEFIGHKGWYFSSNSWYHCKFFREEKNVLFEF